MTDKIVYLVVTKGGGIDGLDYNDKGGKVKYASYNKQETVAKVTPWDELKKEIIDDEEVYKAAIKKLDAIDKLVLDIED